jgi:hypothetical protein
MARRSPSKPQKVSRKSAAALKKFTDLTINPAAITINPIDTPKPLSPLKSHNMDPYDRKLKLIESSKVSASICIGGLDPEDLDAIIKISTQKVPLCLVQLLRLNLALVYADDLTIEEHLEYKWLYMVRNFIVNKDHIRALKENLRNFTRDLLQKQSSKKYVLLRNYIDNVTIDEIFDSDFYEPYGLAARSFAEYNVHVWTMIRRYFTE